MKILKRIYLALTLVMLCSASLLCLSACGEMPGKLKKPSPVDVSTIRYDGEVLSWAAAKDATSYDIQFNNTNTTVYSTKFMSGVSSTANEVRVTVTAKNSAGSAETVGKTFTRLKTINASDLRFDVNGIMSWDHVDGATEYMVEINGKECSNGASNIFSNFAYGQRNTIRVKPMGGSDTFSSYGTSTVKTYLSVPTSVVYDGEIITWAGTELAKSYTLYINGGEYARDIRKTSCDYITSEKRVKIAVQSIGDGVDSFSSRISEAIECVKLDDVSGIRVEEGVLKWDAVEYATEYRIKLKSSSSIKSSKTCELGGIPTGEMLSISIKPISGESDYFFSSWSETKNAFVLIAPTLKWNSDLSLDGEKQKALYWDNSLSADGYKVEVVTPSGEKDIYDASTNDPSLSYDYLESGDYKIRIKATSTQTDYYESAYSDTFKVRRLEAPKLLTRDAILSDENKLSEGFTVKFQRVEGATYGLYKDGTQIQNGSNASFLVRNVLSEYENQGCEISYSIRSLGKTTSQVVVLDSLTEKATTFSITVLPTPSDLYFNGSSLEWTAVNSSNGYSIKTDGSFSATSSNAYSLIGLTSGEHKLSVCAKGNGKDVLPSPYTAEKSAYKLSAPTDVEIDTDTNEGTLKCSNVEYVKSYTVYFNGSSEGITNASLSNVNVKTATLNSTNGLSVVLTANADYEENDVYYISSNKSKTYSFTKIKPVDKSSVKVQNQILSWNKPENVSQSTASSVSYNIYKADGIFWKNCDTTSMDFSTLGGGEYNIFIQCKGDGKSTFNSERSELITINKLETPTLGVNSTLDGYTWRGVVDATAYSFKIGSNEIKRIDHSGVKDYQVLSSEFISSMNNAGTYKVSVTAVGNANNLVIDSNAVTLEQTVKMLTKPTLSAKYDKGQVSEDGNLVAEVGTLIDYSNGYRFSFSGTNVTDRESENGKCSYNTGTPHKYTITVRAKGGKFDENGNLYCDSEMSDAVDITLLSAPSKDSITKTIDNKISWNAISGTSRYKLEIEYDDGSKVELTVADKTSYSVNAGDKKIVSVSVTALGNGNSTITSKTVKKEFNV